MAEPSVPRVVAICEGGPYDGQMFSVAVGDDGKPQPITNLGDMPEGSKYQATGRRRKLGDSGDAFDASHNLGGSYTFKYSKPRRKTSG